jgi:uncharacterized OB-fold protein
MTEQNKDIKEQFYYPGTEHWEMENDVLHLVGSHCKKCGQNYFPAREICPKCFAEGQMEKVRFSNQGKLYSYSVVHVAPKQFSPPYAVGYVDFPEGVRVLAQLTTTDPKQIRLDMDVQTLLGKICVDEQGREIVSYKFRPL